MPTGPDEGRGASLTLGSGTWHTSALITSLTFGDITREPLETTRLATSTAREFMPADLYDPGTLTVEFLHHDAVAMPMGGTTSITVTYPLQAGQTTAASVSGNGFCISYTPAAARVGELMRGTATFKYTGALTFTAAT